MGLGSTKASLALREAHIPPVFGIVLLVPFDLGTSTLHIMHAYCSLLCNGVSPILGTGSSFFHVGVSSILGTGGCFFRAAVSPILGTGGCFFQVTEKAFHKIPYSLFWNGCVYLCVVNSRIGLWGLWVGVCIEGSRE